MTQAEKFLFRTSFDEAALAREAERAGKPKAPSYGQEDLAEAEHRAFGEGKQAGLTEALASAEQALAEATSAIERELAGAGQMAAEVNRRREERAIAVAVAILRKLFPRLAAKGGLEEVEALIQECLSNLEDEPRIVIRICDAQFDALKERLDPITAQCGFEGRVVLLAEAGLSEGDARVEWADGGAEHVTEALWAKIDALLARNLSMPDDSAQASAPSSLPSDATLPALDHPPEAGAASDESLTETAAPEPQAPETPASV